MFVNEIVSSIYYKTYNLIRSINYPKPVSSGGIICFVKVLVKDFQKTLFLMVV